MTDHAHTSELLAGSLPTEAIGHFELPGGSVVPCASPSTLEELEGALALARAEAWACLVVGNGSRLVRPPGPARVDVVLRMRAFGGVVAYEPGDGTLTARAGASLEELASRAAGGGHHLTPDVALPAESTLGGVLASGVNGLDRLRCGPTRHNVLGMRVLLTDGTKAKSGGRLVKNVTGYDLHRLFCGSAGTLGIILEATLRLYPGAQARVAVTRDFGRRAEALASASTLADEHLRPFALCVRDVAPGRWQLALLLGGREDVVAWEAERIGRLIEGVRVLEGEDERELARALRDGEPGAGFDLATRRSLLPAALEHLGETLAAHAMEARTLAHPALGSASIRLAPATDPARFPALQRALIETGLRVRWHGAGAALDDELDTSLRLPASPAAPLMRRLKRSLDPHGLLPSLSPAPAPASDHGGT